MKTILVPANSSRTFARYEDAVAQKVGLLKVEIHPLTGHLYNSTYEQSSIMYDTTYKTVNPFHFAQSINEFSKLHHILSGSFFVEIGCGQGEFVEYLKSLGEEAIGFDPVCEKKRPYLLPEVFTPEKRLPIPKNFDRITFILRCVLPHIQAPFEFISEIQERWPEARFLMQHQRIEHFIDTVSWHALMHDHVNIFTKEDFTSRYNVLADSEFSSGEWQQILLSGRPYVNKRSNSGKLLDIEKLMCLREKQLEQISEFEELVLFGGAGKGINFAYACASVGIGIKAVIDDSPDLAGRYLEGSGVEVVSSADEIWTRGGLKNLFVMNHNHEEYARNRFKNFAQVLSTKSLESLSP